MAEFEQLRDELASQRRELEARRSEALLTREAVRKGEAALDEFARTETPRRAQERARMEETLEAARARLRRLDQELVRLSDTGDARRKAFEGFTDPREQLHRLHDSHPILLFPLRLETRFKTAGEGQPQLWVRVYPDNCLVDSFEESFTEKEVENARRFWASIWRAGGEEVLERAAWRELVASHGSGRSGWIVRQYVPLNPNDKPGRDNPTDVLLIITAPPVPPAEVAAYWQAWRDANGDVAAEQAALAALELALGADQARVIADGTPPFNFDEVVTYWQARWTAEGDAAAEQAAFAALKLAVGTGQAQAIADGTRPFNFDDAPSAPRTRAEVQLKVAVLRMTPLENLKTRRTSWSSPPRVELLPERFVLVASSRTGTQRTEIGNPILAPLVAGPNPNAPPGQRLEQVEDTLRIPDELAWMFDFERALEVGMAFRFDLTPQQAKEGFERIVVLGVRLGDSPEEGAKHLAKLFEHHLHSRTGLEILPQGTPTNNTEKGGSGYSFRDDAEATFETYFRQTPLYLPQTDPLLRRDGQWFAELLGLPHELVQRIKNADGLDQSEARAMQIALWPGTLGYMMKTQLAGVFSEEGVAATRSFFTRYVSGRGPLPSLRIGTQPYGILPTTAFDRVNWFSGKDQQFLFLRRSPSFLPRLYAILKRIDDDWKPLVEQVSFIGKRDGNPDPHQILLDVLGLHPNSVEYHPLGAESVEHKFYELAFLNYSMALDFFGLFPAIIPLTLLRSLGYTGEQVPDLLNKVYKTRQTPLDGPVIDDRPLSETEWIRHYAGDKNYIEWLIDAARTGFEALQQENGFDGDKKPAALLYLLLRHALQLSFHETGVKLATAAGAIKDATLQMREPAFVHVSQQAEVSESRYDLLFRSDERITRDATLLLGDYIARNVMVADPDLREQIEALERLSQVSTARLERIFAEHIDCCSYRLDAWKTGLFGWQLEQLRQMEAQPESPGLFLGAFGWLELLRPEGKVLTPVKLPEDLDLAVNRRDTSPLLRDNTNGGLIHAPSLNHATTAAVLRNGYLANDGRLAVNLSSRRVQLALGILEGMRNGQSLGALLGYQFERHVHDNGPLQVRALIYPMRRAFPLVADQTRKIQTGSVEAREAIAAMNVVDGRKLIEHVESTQNFIYPFGVTTLARDAGQEPAITNALAHIRNINDAVADLVLAEGVHQAVLGNYDRSAGTLDAFSKGNYPPEMEVIRTPRSGIALTLRTAIHFSPTPAVNPVPLIPLTPLALAEPAVNAWLAGRLPPVPADIGCQVMFTSRTTNIVETVFISQQQLGLHPIDLVYRAETTQEQALGDLDDRILRYLEANHAPRHDREVLIQHTERLDGRVTWFELQALLRSLRPLVTASRSLQPADLMRANDATISEQSSVSLPVNRVEARRDDLRNVHLPALDVVATALANPGVTIDDALSQFAETVGRLAEYRLPQTGTGFVFEWRAAAYVALTAKLAERINVWEQRLIRFDARIGEYESLPLAAPEEERIKKLQEAEIIISTQMAPPVPASGFRAALGVKRTSFVNKRDDLQQLIDTPSATLTQLLNEAKAELPLTDFDPDPLDFTKDDAEIARFRTQLTDAVAQLKSDLLKRLDRVDALLTQHAAAGAADRVNLLQKAVKQIFGDDFQMVPHITLPRAATDELANAWQHSISGDLTRHLMNAPSARDFPVDDWLHGVARVRDKLRHWENAVLLGDAFRAEQSPDLTPLQLPFKVDDPWLALEIPDGHEITSDCLLYTAHFAEQFDKTQPLCGLLLDEWTEVIPGTDETTGIAFHYDRPNCEPPQSWLLALPAVRDGAWSWEELLGAVNHALDSAKCRAIEPVHIDNTPYSWFLPATMSSYTFPEISISNNLLRNVRIYSERVKE